MTDQNVIEILPPGGFIWAVAAIHGEVERLRRLHLRLNGEFSPGDKIVYLGNYFGYGPAVHETIDDLLLFRRLILARPEGHCHDVVFLRGQQEEMWQKLLQIQFAPNPSEILNWMGENGIESTLRAYGSSLKEGMTALREGVLSLTRWTSELRRNMRARDGHVALTSCLRHAAMTDDNHVLFVHSGIDPFRRLTEQGDIFWWGGAQFDGIASPCLGFKRVIRGYDRKHGGVKINSYTACLDAGCGIGGPLTAIRFNVDTGEPDQVIEA